MGRRLPLLAAAMLTGVAAACTGGPSDVGPTGGPSTVVQTTSDAALHCYDAIDAIDSVPAGSTVALDVVALPTGRVLQTAPNVETDPAARDSAPQWVAFAGGYYVAEPMCLPIVVEPGGRREVVRIAVGTACEPT